MDLQYEMDLQELLNACKSGNITSVQNCIISCNNSAKGYENDFCYALAISALFKRMDILKLLLKVDDIDPMGRNYPEVSDYNVLESACESNDPAIFKELLNSEKTKMITERHHIYLMHLSIKKGNIDILRELLTYKNAALTEKASRIFITAACSNQVDIMKLLLSTKGLSPSFEESKALLKAVSHGHYDIVKLLLDDKRSNPSCRENKALMKAIIGGKTEIVKLILSDNRADPSSGNNKALVESRKRNYQLITEELLKDHRVLEIELKNQN